MSRSSRQADARNHAGCAWFVATFVMPVLSFVVAAGALFTGAMLTITCERIAPRITGEVVETSGVITRPVERVVQEGGVAAVHREVDREAPVAAFYDR